MANENTLLTIYGCKLSKDGKKLVLTLVRGRDEDKEYYNACIKLDNSGKTHAKVEKDKKHALIKVEMLKGDKQPTKKQTKSKDADVEAEDEGDIPF